MTCPHGSFYLHLYFGLSLTYRERLHYDKSFLYHANRKQQVTGDLDLPFSSTIGEYFSLFAQLPCFPDRRNHSLVQSRATYTTRLGRSADAATAFLKPNEIYCETYYLGKTRLGKVGGHAMILGLTGGYVQQ